MKPIAVYIRVSTSGQSYASQEEPLRKFCRAEGWKQQEYDFLREKISGVWKDRPVLNKILEGVRLGEVRTVVVFSLDRIGRSPGHAIWVVEQLLSRKVRFVCISQGIDTSEKNSMSSIQVTLFAALAAIEREITRERTAHGRRAALKRGVKLGRPAKWSSYAPLVRELRAAGKNFAQIQTRVQQLHKVLMPMTTIFRLSAGVQAPKSTRGPDQRPRKKRIPEYPPKIRGVAPSEAKSFQKA